MSVELSARFRQVCVHESSHASSFILSGIMPLAIRADLPRPDVPGVVCLPWDEMNILRDATLRALLVGVLAPAALTDDLRDDWPIVPDDWGGGCRADARWARNLCGFLGYSQVDYLQHAERARRLTSDARYCRLLLDLTDELEEHEGLLVRSEIAAIAERIV
jgi:hypothetical protein